MLQTLPKNASDSPSLCLKKALNSGQGGGSVAFGPGLMLLPAMEDAVLQEGRRKRYAFVALGSVGLKVIFALLTKIIAFQVRVAIMEIRVPGLQRPIQDILSGF